MVSLAADASLLVVLKQFKNLVSRLLEGGERGSEQRLDLSDEQDCVALSDMLELLKLFASEPKRIGSSSSSSSSSSRKNNTSSINSGVDKHAYAKTIFYESEEAKLFLKLLVSASTNQDDSGTTNLNDLLYIRADVFALLAVLHEFFPRHLEESLLQTPLVFQVLLETLHQSSAFVRNECLNFVISLLEGDEMLRITRGTNQQSSMVANILIMQGLFEFLLGGSAGNLGQRQIPDLQGGFDEEFQQDHSDDSEPLLSIEALEEAMAASGKLHQSAAPIRILILLLQTERGCKYLREADLVSRLWSLFGQHFQAHLKAVFEEELMNSSTSVSNGTSSAGMYGESTMHRRERFAENVLQQGLEALQQESSSCVGQHSRSATAG
ncbi:unnamed protein product, partial [Amoebophrya sp. A120]|eukprot:GSA120T00010471001.1